MNPYAATFEHDPAWSESLKGPLFRSFMLHLAVIGGFTAYALLGAVEKFGDKDAGGAVVGITAVKSIPLVSRGEPNPVAHDTTSVAPPPPAPVQKAAPKAQPEKDPREAIALEKSKRLPPPTQSTLKSFSEIAKNQVTSKSAPAASDPLFSVTGAGQIGVSQNSVLGSRFGAYAAQLRQIVQQNWNTSDVPAAIKTARQVMVVFTLARNGTASNIRLTQRSGVAELDFSVQRAIQISSFPELPREYEKDSVEVEFQFELRR
jgi:protein TonB